VCRCGEIGKRNGLFLVDAMLQNVLSIVLSAQEETFGVESPKFGER
jgi:hypothetical protein